MRQTFAFLVFCILQFSTVFSFAADPFFEDFQAGIQAYQKQDFKSAEERFNHALTLAPKNAAVLSNLGLAELQLDKKGLAISHFRAALVLDPGLSVAAQGLRAAISKLPVKEIPHRLETYESLREIFLEPVSLLSYLILTSFTLFVSGWLILTYLGQRRRALAEQTAAPAAPGIGILFGVLFIFLTALSLLKVWDNSQPRASILQTKVSVQSAPGENGAILFDLYEGLEVIVRQHQSGWTQISYPGGMTGWIPDAALGSHSI